MNHTVITNNNDKSLIRILAITIICLLLTFMLIPNLGMYRILVVLSLITIYYCFDFRLNLNQEITTLVIFVNCLLIPIITYNNSTLWDWHNRTILCLLIFTTYYICKRNNDSVFFRKSLTKIIIIGTIICVLWTIISLAIHIHNLKAVGFNCIYNFRHLFHPLGITNNAWCVILISLLPAAFLSNSLRIKYILTSSLFALILLSFSRGALIALFIFVVGCLSLIKNPNSRKIIILSLLFAVIISFICCYSSFKEMIIDSARVHEGSNNWRLNGIDITAKNINIFHPFGSGIRSYNMICDYSNGMDNNQGFTSVSPNIISRFIFEYGYLGSILIITSLLYIFYELYNIEKIAFFSALAILIKELTGGYIQTIPVIYIIFSIYISLFSKLKFNKDTDSKNTLMDQISAIIIILAIIIVGGTTRLNFKNSNEILSYSLISTKTKEAILMENLIYKLDDYDKKRVTNITLKEYIDQNIDLLKNNHYFPLINLSLPNDIRADLPSSHYSFINNNSYFIFLKSYTHLNHDNINVDLLSQAIIENPAIFLCKDYKYLTTYCPRIDSITLHKIKDTNKTALSPKEMAKYGILLHYYRQPEATLYLKESLNEMPNLLSPWEIIDNKKYLYLKYGNQNYSKRNDDEPKSILRLILEEYQIRHLIWYGKSSLSH